MQVSKKNIFILSAGLVLAVVFIWLAFRGLALRDLLESMVSVSAWALILALLFYILEQILRIWRWQWQMRPFNASLSLKDCAAPYLLSLAANHFIPVRIGDLFRIFAYHTRLKVSPSQSAGVILVERVVDLLVYLFFFCVGLKAVNLTMVPRSYISGALYLAVILSALLFVAVVFSKQAGNILDTMLSAGVLKKWGMILKIREWFKQFFEALSLMGKPAYMIKLFVFSLLLWMVEVFMFFVIARDLFASMTVVGSMFAFSVGALCGVLPTAPGMIGTLDYFLMFGVMACGMKRVSAVSFAILTHAYFFFVALIIAVYYLFIRESRKIIGSVIFKAARDSSKANLNSQGAVDG
ncbi:MAG: flippase-like domain-containing protein [Deltaproteobacteria bacterium]|nr:flippase-like domain-containing protein [Deltaproteobacteria bacterium]